MWYPGRSKNRYSSRRKRKESLWRLVKGIGVGLLGAVIFLALIVTVYFAFQFAEPYVSDAVARIFESDAVERIVNSDAYQRAKTVVGRYV